MSDVGNARVWRLVAIVLRSKDPEALAGFYRATFDFVDAPSTADDARSLTLGDTHLRIDRAGADPAAHPRDVAGWSPLFQHFAIRVTDMDAAMRRLEAADGWRPISTDGPERLPANTGGVVAFKFRDPEGHPLEFLAFPDRSTGPLFAGIDHSAISVVDVARSIAFYQDLGLVVAGRSLNTGIEQSRLDAIDGATVDVVALRTASGAAPHLELLGYRGSYDRGGPDSDPVSDRIATRLSFAGRPDDDAARVDRQWRDPDGHLLEFARGAIPQGTVTTNN